MNAECCRILLDGTPGIGGETDQIRQSCINTFHEHHPRYVHRFLTTPRIHSSRNHMIPHTKTHLTPNRVLGAATCSQK